MDSVKDRVLACFALVDAVERVDVVVVLRIRAALVEPDAVVVTIFIGTGTADTAAVAVAVAILSCIDGTLCS